MKNKVFLLFALVLAERVPSWNPFYTEKDLLFDPALVGAQRPVEAKKSSEETREFAKASDKLYRLAQTPTTGSMCALSSYS